MELKPIQSVFNIEIEKIDPNPGQPRQQFDEASLRDLSESIRRYGVMQPITVVRRESEREDGSVSTRYEIIAGERRWRASILAGMKNIPALIHEEQSSEQERYEMSILENLQREDLNPVDKARSFQKLYDEFGMKQAEIADKLGKSREYVTNAMRILALPDEILDALSAGEISEGHTRPLLALKDKPEELMTLFREIKTKNLSVRNSEQVGRDISGVTKATVKRAGTKANLDPEMQSLQNQLAETLGTQVSIDKKEQGGKLTIDFFSRDDLKKLLAMVGSAGAVDAGLAHMTTQATEAEQATSQTTTGNELTQASTESQEAPLEDSSEDFFQFKQPMAGFADEDVVTPQAEPSAPRDQVRSPGADTLQAQINELAGQTTAEELALHETVPENHPIQVDLGGDINPTESTYASKAVEPRGTTTFKNVVEEAQFGEAPPYQKVDATGSDIDRSYPGTVSESVFAQSPGFVPEAPSQAQETEVSVAGSEFVPMPATDKAPDQSTGQTPQAEVTMGGLGGGSLQGPSNPNAQATPKADDPYRLDNFAV